MDQDYNPILEEINMLERGETQTRYENEVRNNLEMVGENTL